MEWHILGILAFVVIYNLYRYYHEDDSIGYRSVATAALEDNQNKTIMEESISTRQMALNTIERIGSTPQYTEEGRIQFEYQGVIFLMEAATNYGSNRWMLETARRPLNVLPNCVFIV